MLNKNLDRNQLWSSSLESKIYADMNSNSKLATNIIRNQHKENEEMGEKKEEIHTFYQKKKMKKKKAKQIYL